MDKIFTKLKNNTDFAYKRNLNTPRCAMYFNLSLPDTKAEAGVYSLMTRLFMQGTKKYAAQQLSEELDKYAIEFVAELKLDYVKFKFVCLNEDFEKALEIFTDIIKNTTFEEFDKEKAKLEGEIIAELDSPRAKVLDSYYKNIYEGHRYGITNTVILENLKNVQEKISDLGLENISVSKTEQGLKISLENIGFLADSAVLENSEKEKLLKIGMILDSYPDNDLLVSGHTARVGSEESCQLLSEKRASAVASFLIENKIRAENHIFTRGFGSKIPASTNATEEGRSKNRRVEITILDR